MNAFFLDRHNFAPFSNEHWLLFTAYSFVAIYLIYYCQKSANPQQYQRPLVWFLGFITLLQLAKPFIRLHYGMFDIKDDLPFHLCNMLPLLMWLAVGSGSRFWFSVFSFWIIIGTSQSLITPTVTETFPHYESIRYWTVHFGLTFAALFGWIVFKWLPTYKVAGQSWLLLNGMALGMYMINLGLDSNYWYLRGKPAEDTALSMLWSWPYYLLQLEAIALLSFLALVAIIKKLNKN
ncbi:MAG: TIGR02206 family membrane protein [Saprospiraceae bacterium]|nr:TIGR02206 family membrane protein [Saprospiraceae bacterium]